LERGESDIEEQGRTREEEEAGEGEAGRHVK
jgi:hypothetical protein